MESSWPARDVRAHVREAGRQLGEVVGGGARARELVVVEGQAAVVVEDRDEGSLEASLGDGHLGAVLAVDGELVALLAGEPLDGGDQVGRDALRDHRVLLAEVGVVGGEAVDVQRRRPRHRLDAAADDEVLEAGQDARGGEVHGLLARAAEAVERDAGRVERPAGVERGHAGDVHRVVAAAGAAAHDHVVDVGGVEAVALLQGVEHLRQDALRVDGVQRAGLLALAARRAHGVDDPGFAFHRVLLVAAPWERGPCRGMHAMQLEPTCPSRSR